MQPINKNQRLVYAGDGQERGHQRIVVQAAACQNSEEKHRYNHPVRCYRQLCSACLRPRQAHPRTSTDGGQAI